MMKMIYVLTFFVRESSPYREYDMKMVQDCFFSLQQSEEKVIVIYNQGCLTNSEIRELLVPYHVNPIIIGDGGNIGIAQARQACFEYIWNNFSEVPFICEIHVDMVFPVNWYQPLIEFLENSDEPLISPGVFALDGKLYPENKSAGVEEIPSEHAALCTLLEKLKKNELREGFLNPVIYKSNVLKEVGGYDCRFLKGKQGYEDDSLLLGFLYYMGTRTQWTPKCNLKSWIYHATGGQRMTIPGKEKEFALNLNGLFCQYGANGFRQLARMRHNIQFEVFYNDVLQHL